MPPVVRYILDRLDRIAFAAGAALAVFSPWARAAMVLIAVASFLPLWRTSWPVMKVLVARAGRRVERARQAWHLRRFQLLRALVVPSWLSATWILALWMVLLGFVAQLLSNEGPNDPWFNASIQLALLVAAVDASRLVWGVLRWTWGSPLGKACLGFAGALVGSLAVSFARRLVFGLTGEDPAKTPTAVTFISALMAPRAWLSGLGYLGLVAFIPVCGASIWGWAAGRERRRKTRPPLQALMFWVRPVLICVAPLFATETLPRVSLSDSFWLKSQVSAFVARMDYVGDAPCGRPATAANRLDDHRVSVARDEAGSVRLLTIVCDRPPSDTEPKSD